MSKETYTRHLDSKAWYVEFVLQCVAVCCSVLQCVLGIFSVYN